jgi:hypothetical protein
VTLFSRDYVPVVEQLAPLLPKGFSKAMDEQIWEILGNFLDKTDIQDDSYIDVQAPPFFAQGALTFKEQFKDALRFFEDLEKVKDNEAKMRELTTQFSHLQYFWFAREFDHPLHRIRCEGSRSGKRPRLKNLNGCLRNLKSCSKSSSLNIF